MQFAQLRFGSSEKGTAARALLFTRTKPPSSLKPPLREGLRILPESERKELRSGAMERSIRVPCRAPRSLPKIRIAIRSTGCGGSWRLSRKRENVVSNDTLKKTRCQNVLLFQHLPQRGMFPGVIPLSNMLFSFHFSFFSFLSPQKRFCVAVSFCVRTSLCLERRQVLFFFIFLRQATKSVSVWVSLDLKNGGFAA